MRENRHHGDDLAAVPGEGAVGAGDDTGAGWQRAKHDLAAELSLQSKSLLRVEVPAVQRTELHTPATVEAICRTGELVQPWTTAVGSIP